jgi:hypothetical protein
VTPKRRLFVEHYLGTALCNGAEAARRAGYADPKDEAHRLLREPEVAKLIEERIAEAAMGANEVLARMADIGRGSIEHFIDDKGAIDLEKARAAAKLHLVEAYACDEVYELGQGDLPPSIVRKQKFKLHSALAALVTLGKGHRLWADRLEHSGEGGGPIPLAIREIIVKIPETDADA